MPSAPLRWLARNLSTLLMAFILAVVVWVSAILAFDPNEERQYPRAVTLELSGLDPGLLQVGRIPAQVRVSINAPRSVWDQLTFNTDRVRAWIDLSGYGAGQHEAPVRVQVSATPARVTSIDPEEVTVELEALVSREFQIELGITGEPALGYRRGSPQLDPGTVTITGAESEVAKVIRVTAKVDISNANTTIRRNLVLEPKDALGQTVSAVTVSPALADFTLSVDLLGGYRNVVVKVLTTGDVAEGYWLTNINVTPPNVTVFSTNPRLVNDLPGFVETNPVDMSGLSDDTDIRATLDLPEGVTLAGDESVLVRLSIAALEGSLPIALPLEVIGLPPELNAVHAPDTVDVMLAGPLPILNNLNPAGIRLVVNLNGLGLGTHQVPPVIDLLPNQVRVAYIQPETVEVNIIEAPTPTPEGFVASSTPVTTGTPQP